VAAWPGYSFRSALAAPHKGPQGAWGYGGVREGRAKGRSKASERARERAFEAQTKGGRRGERWAVASSWLNLRQRKILVAAGARTFLNNADCARVE
jgi:hypothetical protein